MMSRRLCNIAPVVEGDSKVQQRGQGLLVITTMMVVVIVMMMIILPAPARAIEVLRESNRR